MRECQTHSHTVVPSSPWTNTLEFILTPAHTVLLQRTHWSTKCGFIRCWKYYFVFKDLPCGLGAGRYRQEVRQYWEMDKHVVGLSLTTWVDDKSIEQHHRSLFCWSVSPHSDNHIYLHTSSRILFLARVMAAFRTLIQDSFSSGLTARKTRLGTYNTHKKFTCTVVFNSRCTGMCWHCRKGSVNQTVVTS